MSEISFSVGPSTHVSSVSAHCPPASEPRLARAPRSPGPGAGPAGPAGPAGAGPGAGPELDFPRWFLAMFETLMNFLAAAVFLPHGKYHSSLPLAEALQKLRMLAGVRVSGGAVGEDDSSAVGSTVVETDPELELQRRLSALPPPVADGVQALLQRLDAAQEQRLEREGQWCGRWVDSHLRMAEAFASSSGVLRQRLAQDLKNVEHTAGRWQETVRRMLASQRTQIEERVERMVRRWRHFLQQSKCGGEVLQVQHSMLEGVRDMLVAAIRGKTAWCGGGGTSFMSLVQHFVESRGGGVRGSERLDDKLEQVFQKLLQLEDQQAANRKRRRRAAADAQHDASLAPQLQRLDQQHGELVKEHAVLGKMRQEILHRQEGRIREGHTQAQPWDKLAWRFATPILEMENHVFRFSSLSKRLERAIGEVHAEITSSSIASVKLCVDRMVRHLWQELRRHLHGGAPDQPAAEQERVERELGATYGCDHDIHTLLELHRRQWVARRRQLGRRCRNAASARLGELVSGRGSRVHQMIRMAAGGPAGGSPGGSVDAVRSGKMVLSFAKDSASNTESD
jgi:hypothetical protein